jgi:hypothetical protein
LRRFLPGIKNALLIGLAIAMACAFIWQRIAIQNLSADINRAEQQVRQLEKNRDYLKGEILYRSSLEQVRKRAISELGMRNSADSELLPFPEPSMLTARAEKLPQGEKVVSMAEPKTGSKGDTPAIDGQVNEN